MSWAGMNHWGWGRAADAPGEQALREYKGFLEDTLGFPERPVLDPVPVEEVSLREPGVEPSDAIAGFTTGASEARIHRAYGSSRIDLARAIRGQYDHPPDLVATPEAEDDVRDLLAWATEHRVAVVPYGGGTGVVGGTEGAVGDGYAGVVSLDLGRLDRVLEVDHESRRARIQAGVRGPALNDQLAEHDVHLRHYPQSYEFSTLGGWIATRSGGHYATRYTHIDEFVESARMITPAGTFETLRIPAGGAGPDPNRLVMGSEGMLGVITEAWMRVEPRPRYRSDASVGFESLEAAVRAIRRIVQARLYPANCRLHDTHETSLYGLTDVDEHLVVLGFESTDHSTEPRMARALEICTEEGGAYDEPVHYGPGFGREKPAGDEKQRWGQAFMEGPYKMNLDARLAVVAGTIETAVTWDRFHGFHEAITDALRAAIEEECGTGMVGTRFTHVYPDGPAPYITFAAAGTLGEEIGQHRRVKAAGMAVVREYGLTVTHHHAVGRDHMEWYARERPEGYGEALRAVKAVLDPAGIMNPGVLVEDPAV